jgi:hypothetical protein
VQEIQFAQRGTLRQIATDDPALADGFHRPDPAGGPRWTMGSARLDTAQLRLMRGPMRIQITAIGLASYPIST